MRWDGRELLERQRRVETLLAELRAADAAAAAAAPTIAEVCVGAGGRGGVECVLYVPAL